MQNKSSQKEKDVSTNQQPMSSFMSIDGRYRTKTVLAASSILVLVDRHILRAQTLSDITVRSEVMKQ